MVSVHVEHSNLQVYVGRLINAMSCLVPRGPHVFQCTWKKLGRPGWSGDVIGHGLRRGCVSPPTHSCIEHDHDQHMTNSVGKWAEIHNRGSNRVRLHHLIDQALPMFLLNIEAWVRPYEAMLWELGSSMNSVVRNSMQQLLHSMPTLSYNIIYFWWACN